MSSSKLLQAFWNKINFCVDVGRPFLIVRQDFQSCFYMEHILLQLPLAHSHLRVLSIVLATKSGVLQIFIVTWSFVSLVLTSSKFLRFGSMIQRFPQ